MLGHKDDPGIDILSIILKHRTSRKDAIVLHRLPRVGEIAEEVDAVRELRISGKHTLAD